MQVDRVFVAIDRNMTPDFLGVEIAEQPLAYAFTREALQFQSLVRLGNLRG